MTLLEALLLAHIILNIAILLLIAIVEAKLSTVKDAIDRLYDKAYLMRRALERLERRLEELDKKVAG
jgi:hypothetical protein